MYEKLIELLEPYMSGEPCDAESGSCELMNCRTCDAITLANRLIFHDVVPVVRCKDCVQWHRNCGVTDSPNGHCFTHDVEMNQHDFCSYGERKGGEG